MAKLAKRERNLLIVLMVVVAFGLIDFIINSEDYFSFFGSGKEEQTAKNEETVKKKISEKHKNLKLASIESWGRDPFYDSSVTKRRVSKPKVKRVNLVLKAISFSENMSVAMINNSVLSVGDKVEGYTVKKIESKRVTLQKDGATQILTLQ